MVMISHSLNKGAEWVNLGTFIIILRAIFCKVKILGTCVERPNYSGLGGLNVGLIKFSCDHSICDLQWRSLLCSLCYVEINPVYSTCLCSIAHYDITMGHDVASDIHIVMS